MTADRRTKHRQPREPEALGDFGYTVDGSAQAKAKAKPTTEPRTSLAAVMRATAQSACFPSCQWAIISEQRVSAPIPHAMRRCAVLRAISAVELISRFLSVANSLKSFRDRSSPR